MTEEYAKSQRNKISTGGGVYVNTSGGPTISVSFSVFWGGAVSTGVIIGLASKSSKAGGLYSVDAYLVKV